MQFIYIYVYVYNAKWCVLEVLVAKVIAAAENESKWGTCAWSMPCSPRPQ